jgi:endoglucanase
MILDAGLAVVVDVHPKSTPFSKMRGKPVAERFVGWWEAFARHLSATDPERVFLELLNEPGGQGFWTDGWQPYQDHLLTVIRAAAPEHTLIANGGAYMLVKELANYEPHPDRNVIWSVHYYEPSPFTHQGAQWMKDWYRPLREVPWPISTEEQLAAAIAALAEDKARDKAADVLKDQLKSGRADAAAMRQHLQQVVDWGKKHDRFMYLGEWGVFTKYAPRESRLRYLESFASTAKELGLGWAKWDYCGAGFSVVENPEADSEQRKLDAEVIKSLRLK